MDLFLFSTLFNLVWNVFTILFVLYRFTSFFTYMFGFLRFCGRIAFNTKYYFNRLLNRSGYSRIRLPDDHENEDNVPLIQNTLNNPTSIWSRLKSGANAVTNYFWSSSPSSNTSYETDPSTLYKAVDIPLVESTYRPTFQTSFHPDINTPSKEGVSVQLNSQTQIDSAFDPKINSVDRHAPTFYSNFVNSYKEVVYPFAVQNHPFHDDEESDSSSNLHEYL